MPPQLQPIPANLKISWPATKLHLLTMEVHERGGDMPTRSELAAALGVTNAALVAYFGDKANDETGARLPDNHVMGFVNFFRDRGIPQLQREWLYQPHHVLAELLRESRSSSPLSGGLSAAKKHVATIELVLPLPHRTERLFGRIQGFWEVYHYSVTQTERQAISLSLLHVKEMNKNGLIRYETYDNLWPPPDEQQEPRSWGWCLEAAGFLYFVCQDLYDELKLYIVHQEDGLEVRNVLWGIVLCTNGINLSEDPAAAKVAFRRLGLTAQDAAAKSVVDLSAAGDDAREAESQLKKCVGGYLDDRKPLRPEIYELVEKNILPYIRNEIAANALPLALVMKRPKGS